MMAMTPVAKKQLDEIENAFLEAVEPRRSPTSKPTSKVTKAQSQSSRRGWFSGLKERLVMKFVCCAPPETLLDDDEIQEILMQLEEPVKTKPLPRRDTLTRRSSAIVMPIASSGDVESQHSSLADITQILDRQLSIKLSPPSIDMKSEHKTPIAQEEVLRGLEESPRTHLKLSTIQLAIVCLCSLHKSVEKRSSQRVARFIQSRWRVRQAKPETSVAVPPSPTTSTTEPDIEPETSPAKPSPVISPIHRPRRRLPKTRNSLSIHTGVKQEVHEAVETITQLALTRKRLRSVDVESTTPHVDVERDVHVLFGEEEIDDELLSPLTSPLRSPFAVSRCVSVPPPPTALRPIAVKSTTLIYTRAARVLQRAWRAFRLRQTITTRCNLRLHEMQTQSVMPTIRSKMAELRKRLHDIQERKSLTPCASPTATITDEDYDWL